MKSVNKRETGADSLTDDSDVLWYGTISVGTPAVEYTGLYSHLDLTPRLRSDTIFPIVDFDTGSSDLFLPGPDCGQSCTGHTTYDPSSSSTSTSLDKDFSLAYGDGSTVSGTQYSDVVSINGWAYWT